MVFAQLVNVLCRQLVDQRIFQCGAVVFDLIRAVGCDNRIRHLPQSGQDFVFNIEHLHRSGTDQVKIALQTVGFGNYRIAPEITHLKHGGKFGQCIFGQLVKRVVCGKNL